ncbi:MAG: hypothetical protein RLZZ09_3069, partial [Pseudomonadota bacterium]
MNDSLNPKLTKGLINQYPLIYVQSREEQRLERQLSQLSQIHYGDDRPILEWSAAQGLAGDDTLTDPLAVIRLIRKADKTCFYL